MMLGAQKTVFRALSHQMFGNTDKHMFVKECGITHMNNHPQLYREDVTNMEFNAYIAQMSARGTWSHHIIIQAVANAYHCIIHMSQTFLGSDDAIVVKPNGVEQVFDLVFFLGFIPEVHYVSTICLVGHCSPVRKNLMNIKRKLRESQALTVTANSQAKSLITQQLFSQIRVRQNPLVVIDPKILVT